MLSFQNAAQTSSIALKTTIDALCQKALAFIKRNTVKDFEEAFKIFQQAHQMDSNHALTLANLGMCYKKGIGVTPNLKTAITYLFQAAQLNSSLGQFQYAKCLETGEGVEQNIHHAMHYYREASNNGFPCQNKVDELVKKILEKFATISNAQKITVTASDNSAASQNTTTAITAATAIPSINAGTTTLLAPNAVMASQPIHNYVAPLHITNVMAPNSSVTQFIPSMTPSFALAPTLSALPPQTQSSVTAATTNEKFMSSAFGSPLSYVTPFGSPVSSTPIISTNASASSSSESSQSHSQRPKQSRSPSPKALRYTKKQQYLDETKSKSSEKYKYRDSDRHDRSRSRDSRSRSPLASKSSRSNRYHHDYDKNRYESRYESRYDHRYDNNHYDKDPKDHKDRYDERSKRRK